MTKLHAAPMVPEPSSERAAETVMTLMLMLWRRCSTAGGTLAGKTLGLIDFGPVARAVGRRASRGFGMRIKVFGPGPELDQEAGKDDVERVGSLEELLASADIVSLHCRDSVENRHLINARRLCQMKPDALLINTAHGGLVEQQALVHALWFETIGGAGIQVDPGQLDREADLRACDKAILLSPQADETMLDNDKGERGPTLDNVIHLSEHRRVALRALI